MKIYSSFVKTGMLLVLSAVFLGGCGNNGESSPSGDKEPASSTEQVNNATDRQVNVYNWSNYIDDETLPNFEKKTGIKVNYSVYDSNEILLAKILAGNTGYDVVGPSVSYLERQIQADVYLPLDKSKIPNYKDIEPELLKLMESADPGNRYAVPYVWGITTLGINTKKVEAALGGKLPENEWDLLFKPEYAQKLQSCGISIFDSASDTFPVVLHYLGKDVRGSNPDDLKQAAELLMSVRPYIKRFTTSGYLDDLARGDSCLVLGYGGDFNTANQRAKEAKTGHEIKALLPKSGVGIWIDVLTIPKDAKNVDEALAFINYTLDAQVAAKNADFIAYAPGSAPAKALMREDYRNNPSIFPPADKIKEGFLLMQLDPKNLTLTTQLWSKIKKGS